MWYFKYNINADKFQHFFYVKAVIIKFKFGDYTYIVKFFFAFWTFMCYY